MVRTRSIQPLVILPSKVAQEDEKRGKQNQQPKGHVLEKDWSDTVEGSAGDVEALNEGVRDEDVPKPATNSKQ